MKGDDAAADDDDDDDDDGFRFINSTYTYVRYENNKKTIKTNKKNDSPAEGSGQVGDK